MWQRLLPALAGLLMLGGCAGAVHQLPMVSQDNLSIAQTELEKAGGAPARQTVSDDEVRTRINAAVDRIRPAATQVCREMNVGVCDWQIVISNNRALNASAGPNGVITVNRGIVEYAENEEQIAMVIGHEMAHQAANHLVAAQRNQMVGAMIGGILLGAVSAIASSRNSNSAAITARAVSAGANVGAAVGRISYSKEQEREADYLAALILYRSDMDLDKARGFLVTMARASGRKETGMLDSHPAGPERLAAWDRDVEEIRAAKGALPKQK